MDNGNWKAIPQRLTLVLIYPPRAGDKELSANLGG